MLQLLVMKVNLNMSDWQTLRKRDKLAICGFAPTTRHMAPFGNPEYDFYALNEEYNYDWMCKTGDDGKPLFNELKHEVTAWFQIHPRWDFTRSNNMNHFNHPNWLMDKEAPCIRCQGTGELENVTTHVKFSCPECDNGTYKPPTYRKNLPIIMQSQWDDIPNSIEFPLKEATEVYGLGRPYFTSYLSLMITLTYLLEYKHVELYGFEMGTDTEYHYQRANGEFIMGFLQAKGMDIILPKDSGILKGELYGYKNMKTGFRQNLEMRSKVLAIQEGEHVSKVNQLSGQVTLLQELMVKTEPPNLTELFETKAKEYDKARQLHSVVKGAIAETKNMTGMYDKYFLSK